MAKSVFSSLAYAQRCYRENFNPRDCAVFVQSRLQWKTDHEIKCSFFDMNICLSDFGNLRLDNDYIKSDYHLDINSSPEKRFLIRTVVDCAFLRTKGYTKTTKFGPRATDDGEGLTSTEVTEYFYGNTTSTNSTFELSSTFSDVSSSYRTLGFADYDYGLRSVD